MLSVVLPVYNEENQIEKTVAEVKNTIKQLGEEYEIIIIDDGSTDNSWEVLKNLADKNAKFRHTGSVAISEKKRL